MKINELECILNELDKLYDFSIHQEYNTSSSINKIIVNIRPIIEAELNNLKNNKVKNNVRIKVFTYKDVMKKGLNIVDLTNNELDELVKQDHHIIDFNIFNIYDESKSYSYIKYIL